MTRGTFIVIEGGEGAGKSTQLAALKERYEDAIFFTREPGGSPYAEEIRNVILHSPYAADADARTHFSLFWAARMDHLQQTIIPALSKGKNVICDRFDSSTYAYQVYGQRAQELEELFFSVRDLFLGAYKPDLYVYLDIDAETGLERKRASDKANDHFDDRDVQFHERMRRGFQAFFERVPGTVIDGYKDADVITHDIEEVLEEIGVISLSDR